MNPHYFWPLLCPSQWESQQHKCLSLHNLHLCLCFASFIKILLKSKWHTISKGEINQAGTKVLTLSFKGNKRHWSQAGPTERGCQHVSDKVFLSQAENSSLSAVSSTLLSNGIPWDLWAATEGLWVLIKSSCASLGSFSSLWNIHLSWLRFYKKSLKGQINDKRFYKWRGNHMLRGL